MPVSLKKHLQSLTHDELVEEILKLTKKFKDVKAYFDMDLVTNTYGDIDERFYTSTETAYEEALKLIQANNLQEHFRDRGLDIQRQTQDIGWGFSYTMRDLTEKYLR